MLEDVRSRGSDTSEPEAVGCGMAEVGVPATPVSESSLSRMVGALGYA